MSLASNWVTVIHLVEKDPHALLRLSKISNPCIHTLVTLFAWKKAEQARTVRVGLQHETVTSLIFLVTTISQPTPDTTRVNLIVTQPLPAADLPFFPVEANEREDQEVETAESSACWGVTADTESPNVSSFLQIAISYPSNFPRSAEGME